jgi:crossover junction endodeoxyribonuclease RuvC
MVILGLDPGIATVGFGIIKAEKGFFEAVRYGVIRTEAGSRCRNGLKTILMTGQAY